MANTAGLKSVLHKRALARGAKDPLKVDYAGLVPKKAQRQGAVEELRHGQSFFDLLVTTTKKYPNIWDSDGTCEINNCLINGELMN